MRIGGIDADTKSIALVTLMGKPLTWDYIKVPGENAEVKFVPLLHAFYQLRPNWLLCSNIVIEEPVFGANAKASINQAYVIGAIREVLREYGVAVLLVNNAKWKRQVVGSGRSTKADIAAFAVEKLGMREGLQQDIYDAACIAKFGDMHASN